MWRKLVLIVCVLVALSECKVAIKKCTAQDKKCIKESAQELIPQFAKGIPELHVEPFEFLHFEKIDASSANLKLILKDVTFKGVGMCQPKKVSRDASKSKIYGKVICDIEGTGLYDMKGNILILPIEGNGKVKVNLKQILIDIRADIGDIVSSDGVKHWNVKKYDYSFDLKQKSTLNFENLLKNSPLLAKAASDLIDTNSNAVVMEIGTPVIKAVLDRVVENVNHFFHAVPLEDLTLD